MFRAGLYARMSTNDRRILSIQSHTMQKYAARRGCGRRRDTPTVV